jgi:hypothetical protein
VVIHRITLITPVAATPVMTQAAVATRALVAMAAVAEATSVQLLIFV